MEMWIAQQLDQYENKGINIMKERRHHDQYLTLTFAIYKYGHLRPFQIYINKIRCLDPIRLHSIFPDE